MYFYKPGTSSLVSFYFLFFLTSGIQSIHVVIKFQLVNFTLDIMRKLSIKNNLIKILFLLVRDVFFFLFFIFV